MSYILDALKKAERERRLGKVPGLENAPGLHARSQTRSRWTAIIALALVVNAALLGSLYLYWRYQEQPAATMATERQPVESPPALEEIDQPPAQEPPGRLAGTNTPATSASATSASAVSASATSAASPTDPASATKPARSTEARDVDPELTLEASEDGPAMDAEAVAPADAAREFALPPPQSIAPLLADMPESFRSGLRPLTVTVHVYSETPDRRFVFINDQRYQEGQRLAEGPVVESIQPRGVVLSHQGRRFMLTGEW